MQGGGEKPPGYPPGLYDPKYNITYSGSCSQSAISHITTSLNAICLLSKTCNLPSAVSECLNSFCRGELKLAINCLTILDKICDPTNKKGYIAYAPTSSLCGKQGSGNINICADDILWYRYSKFNLTSILFHELMHLCDCCNIGVDRDIVHKAAGYGSPNPTDAWAEQCVYDCLTGVHNVSYTIPYGGYLDPNCQCKCC
jgi:hypothetical protein